MSALSHSAPHAARSDICFAFPSALNTQTITRPRIYLHSVHRQQQQQLLKDQAIICFAGPTAAADKNPKQIEAAALMHTGLLEGGGAEREGGRGSKDI